MVFRAIGSATLQTAEKSGIAKNVVQPPYPCALPLPEIDDIHDYDQVESILDHTFESILDMLDDNLPKLNASVTDAKLNKPWKSAGYKDKSPDGDLVLQSRPHVGAYNFARVMMTFRGVPPALILHYMHAYNLAMRQKYSDSISAYNILCWNPQLPEELTFDGMGNDKFHLPELAELGIRDWHIEYNAYTTPPPVAARDMIYLVEKRYVPETQCYYIYGTSVDLHNCEFRENKRCIRGHVMFGWEFKVVGNDTKARYVSCMNPNGWTPAFLVGFFKSAIGKELTQSREMLYEILRQEAKLNPPAQSRHVAFTDAIKPSPRITVNQLGSSQAGDLPGSAPSPNQQTHQVASSMQSPDSSPIGTRRSRSSSLAPRLTLDIARRLAHHVDADADAVSLGTPFSAMASGPDDSFSFLSRAASSMLNGEDGSVDGCEPRPHQEEEARLCDEFADEELCIS